MKTRVFYKEQLLRAEALIAERRFDEARAILDPLIADADNLLTALGSETSLGLPRRLQSTLLKLAKREADPVRRVGYQYHLVPRPEVVSRHLGYSDEARQAMVRSATESVPRTIHQIWIGTRPVPVTVEAWRAHAARHGYRYRLWREADLEGLGVQENEAFREMLAAGDYPGAVDVARYVILAREGGIYLDCDWYPARAGVSFHHLLPMIGLHAFAEAIPRDTATGSLLLANSFIAAPPGHPVFEAMLTALPGLAGRIAGRAGLVDYGAIAVHGRRAGRCAVSGACRLRCSPRGIRCDDRRCACAGRGGGEECRWNADRLETVVTGQAFAAAKMVSLRIQRQAG